MSHRRSSPRPTTRSEESQDHRSRCKFDVFLSFSGRDIRKGFIDFLYRSLDKAGIRVFRDTEELSGRERILNVIEESKISIPIFSSNYASNIWCLDELVKIIECRKTKNQRVFPVFYDVKPSDVRNQSHIVEEAFLYHEEKFEPVTVGRWREALKEVGSLSGWVSDECFDGHQGVLVEDIVSTVNKELKKETNELEKDNLEEPNELEKDNLEELKELEKELKELVKELKELEKEPKELEKELKELERDNLEDVARKIAGFIWDTLKYEVKFGEEAIDKWIKDSHKEGEDKESMSIEDTSELFEDEESTVANEDIDKDRGNVSGNKFKAENENKLVKGKKVAADQSKGSGGEESSSDGSDSSSDEPYRNKGEFSKPFKETEEDDDIMKTVEGKDNVIGENLAVVETDDDSDGSDDPGRHGRREKYVKGEAIGDERGASSYFKVPKDDEEEQQKPSVEGERIVSEGKDIGGGVESSFPSTSSSKTTTRDEHPSERTGIRRRGRPIGFRSNDSYLSPKLVEVERVKSDGKDNGGEDSSSEERNSDSFGRELGQELLYAHNHTTLDLLTSSGLSYHQVLNSISSTFSKLRGGQEILPTHHRQPNGRDSSRNNENVNNGGDGGGSSGRGGGGGGSSGGDSNTGSYISALIIKVISVFPWEMTFIFYFIFEVLAAVFAQLSYPTLAMIMAALNTAICFGYWYHRTHNTHPKSQIKHRELCASASEFIFSLVTCIYSLIKVPNPLNICPTPLILSFSVMYRNYQKLRQSSRAPNNLATEDTQSDNLTKLALKQFLDKHFDDIYGDIQLLINKRSDQSAISSDTQSQLTSTAERQELGSNSN